MQAKLLTAHDTRTHVLILESGDDAPSKLLEYVTSEHIQAASFTAVGAFSKVVLGYFDVDRKDYDRIPICEQVEVVSMVGDVAVHHGQPKIHAHVVVAKRDGTAHGGHLLEACVRPTLEVVITELPGHLQRELDPETGLALVRP